MSSGPIVDLKSSVDYFLSLFVDWFLAVIHPIEKCQSFLAIEDEGERWHRTFELVGTSFLITVVLNLPLYEPYGIGLSSMGFHICSLVCLTFTLIASGLAVQLSLKLYGVKSVFSEITSIYIACVMCYQPLVAIFSYPSYLRLFTILDSAKSKGEDLGQIINHLLEHATADSKIYDFISISSGFCSGLLLVLSCVCSTLIATTVAEWYSAPRLKSFSALAFATMIFLPPILIAQDVLFEFIFFRFMRLDGSSGVPR